MKQARCKTRVGEYNPETDSIIISVKEARRILGKELSDKLSDEDLARTIGLFHKMAESILDSDIVPNDNVV